MTGRPSFAVSMGFVRWTRESGMGRGWTFVHVVWSRLVGIYTKQVGIVS